jgi:hypothetical protein
MRLKSKKRIHRQRWQTRAAKRRLDRLEARGHFSVDVPILSTVKLSESPVRIVSPS